MDTDAGRHRAGRTRRRGRSVAVAAVLAASATLGACGGPQSVDHGAEPARGALEEPEGAAVADEVLTAEATPLPLVTSTPDSQARVGELVPDFPVRLLPVPGDAVVLVTSAVPVGSADVQEVSLNLRTAVATDELLEMYRAALTVAGFTEVEAAPAPEDVAAETSFTRSGGDELVSIGIVDVDGGRTVTIGGRVRTGDG